MIRNDRGEPVRMIGINLDVTERHHAAEILARANVDLERRVNEEVRAREAAQAQLFQIQKMETIGQISGGIAHDFNNLLAAVLSNLVLLRKRLARAGDAAALKLLDGTVQGAERGTALTQRLLAFARRQDLRPDSVDLAALVGGMETLLRRSLGPTIQIGTDFPADLWPACVDANQLEMALLNLAVNARDAMPFGGTLRISGGNETVAGAGHPAGLAPGAYVRLTVADTGTGMDEATLARAIEPFFTTKGNGKGTGLGLSMVHGMAA